MLTDCPTARLPQSRHHCGRACDAAACQEDMAQIVCRGRDPPWARCRWRRTNSKANRSTCLKRCTCLLESFLQEHRCRCTGATCSHRHACRDRAADCMVWRMVGVPACAVHAVGVRRAYLDAARQRCEGPRWAVAPPASRRSLHRRGQTCVRNEGGKSRNRTSLYCESEGYHERPPGGLCEFVPLNSYSNSGECARTSPAPP